MFNTMLTPMLMYGNAHDKTFSQVCILMKTECDIANGLLAKLDHIP